MQRHKLGSGKQQIEVSSLGPGCKGMSYHRSFIPDKKVSLALIRKACDMGVTLFDTAEAYGPLKNEELVGEALAWLLVQKPWIVPIPGTTKLAHPQENLWSSDFEFSPEEFKTFSETAAKFKIVGDRYTCTQAQQTNK